MIAECVLGLTLMAETKLRLEQLPPAVQTAVKEQTKNASLVGLSKENEHGKTMYEVETKVEGRSRDVTLDASGAVVEVEEEVDIAAIPAAARSAIEKKAAGGKITKIERLTAGPNVSYEAAVTGRSGKKSEFGVNGDGTLR